MLDIDTKGIHGENGMKSYQTLKNTGLITPTLIQLIASGENQLFYRRPKNISVNQVIGLKQGIDTKAHTNNYVIVPPSTTSKGSYQWLSRLPMRGPRAELVKFISKYHPLNNHKNNWSEHHTDKKWTGTVLDNLVEGTPEGQRSNYMTRLCGQIIHAGAGDNTIWLLIQYANSFNSPPLENKELRRVSSSITREEVDKF